MRKLFYVAVAVLLVLGVMPIHAQDYYYTFLETAGAVTPPGSIYYQNQSGNPVPYYCLTNYTFPGWAPFFFYLECYSIGQANASLRTDIAGGAIDGECVLPVGDTIWSTDAELIQGSASLGLVGEVEMSVPQRGFYYSKLTQCTAETGCESYATQGDPDEQVSQPCV